MVARVVPQSARRRHAESRKPDLRGVVARPKAPVLHGALVVAAERGRRLDAVLQLAQLIAHRDDLVRGCGQRVHFSAGARSDGSWR